MPLSVDRLAEIVGSQGQAFDSSVALFPNTKVHAGKVRDNYHLGDILMIVASDRISTFDCVHPNGIPGKGRILTQMSLGWFRLLDGVTPNHLLSVDPVDFPKPFTLKPELEGRSMLVKKLNMLPIECITRGYLTGSAWAEYQRSGTVVGQKVKPGMRESEPFDQPLFTPSTKAESGHDINISFDQMAKIVGGSLAENLRTISLRAYTKAAEYARLRGVIIADTKFEFGLDGGGRVILGDEVLTPDSSRFWPIEGYQPGRSQPSFDKQFVRDWAAGTGWNKEYPAPSIPPEIVVQTQAKYLEAYRRLFI